MSTQEAPAPETTNTAPLEHVACCIAPVGEMDVTLCGVVEMVEPDDDQEDGWEPTCVVCLDLDRARYCPHGPCLYVSACTRGKL